MTPEVLTAKRRFNIAGYADTVGGWMDVVVIIVMLLGGDWRMKIGNPNGDLYIGGETPPDWSLYWWLP